jgi:hypothetical protein
MISGVPKKSVRGAREHSPLRRTQQGTKGYGGPARDQAPLNTNSVRQGSCGRSGSRQEGKVNVMHENLLVG